MTRRVAVVGGGIAGLAAAYRLMKTPGIEVSLLEASQRLGGKIRTERFGPLTFEAGPDSFITAKPEAIGLVRELGLEDRLLPTDEVHKDVYVYAGGRLRRFPEGMLLMAPSRILPFLRSDLMTWRGKLRMGLDLVLPRGRGEDESIGQFTRRRLGAEALERIVDPVMAGIYAGDPDRLSLRSTFPQFLELENTYRSIIRGMRAASRRRASRGGPPQGPERLTMFMTLKDGLYELVDALAAKLGNIVRLGTPVTAVETESNGYVLRLASGKSERYGAVILAAPASAAAELLEGADPTLAAALREIPFASTGTVSLAYDSAVAGALPPGFGFVVPRGEGLRVSAATFTSFKFPGRVPEGTCLIRCFIGGVGREDALALDDAALLDAVRADLKTILGLSAEPKAAKVYRWERASPQYNVGHAARLARIERALGARPGLILAGASYHGVGIPDCIRSGTEAAARAAAAGA